MDDLKDKIKNIADAIDIIWFDLYDTLSAKHLNYDVTIDEEKFNIIYPSNLEEHIENRKKKSKLCNHLLKISINDLIDQVYTGDYFENLAAKYEKSFEPILVLINGHLKPEDVQSKIDRSLYVAAHEHADSEHPESRAIAIDLESTHVNMQRPEWTQEEQEALILKKEEDAN